MRCQPRSDFFDFDVTVSHLNDTCDGRNSSEPVEVGSLSTARKQGFFTFAGGAGFLPATVWKCSTCV